MANQFISPDQGLKIAIRGKTLEKGEIIAPFRNDTWYHVEITTLKTQDGRQKFDVMVTPIGLSGLDFLDELEGFAGIEFGWNSNNPSGAIHMANFVVEDAP